MPDLRQLMLCVPGWPQPIREVVKPENQLKLSEADLHEEVAKMLTANNPAAPKNIVRFNMKDKVYKLEPMVEQTVVNYATDGWLLHKSSDEAKRQLDMEKMEQEASARFQADLDRASHEHKEHGDVEPPDDSRQLRNQFNFSERAAQTLNYPLRDRETFTEPPPTATVSGGRPLPYASTAMLVVIISVRQSRALGYWGRSRKLAPYMRYFAW